MASLGPNSPVAAPAFSMAEVILSWSNSVRAPLRLMMLVGSCILMGVGIGTSSDSVVCCIQHNILF